MQGIPWIDVDPLVSLWLGWLNELKEISRLDAIEIMKEFPNPMLRRKSRSQQAEETIKSLELHFQTVRAFLLHWEQGESTIDLRGNGTGLCETFALLSESRYKKIRGIFDRIDVSQLGKPPCLWLLCEASVCRQMLATSGVEFQELRLKSHSDKENLYQATKTYIKTLWNFETNKPQESTSDDQGYCSLDEILTFLDRKIENLSRWLAVQDTTFDEGYYKPYLRARTHYNVITRRTKEVKILQSEQTTPPKRKRRK